MRIICQLVPRILCAILICSGAVSCRFPGSVKPTVKIGLSAPFEGQYRDLGYQALHAVRLAVRQRNAQGGIGGQYLVELVALNDFEEPKQSIRCARQMAVDPGILAVLGGWSPDTRADAGPEYGRLGLLYVTPAEDMRLLITRIDRQVSPDFRQAYQEISGGAPPTPISRWAYESAIEVLDTMDSVIRTQDRPLRESVLQRFP